MEFFLIDNVPIDKLSCQYIDNEGNNQVDYPSCIGVVCQKIPAFS